jgi:predicted TIM-barrel fold metal-dependent hydrolase
LEGGAIVIDAHAHLVTPDSLYANGLVSLAAQGGHGRIAAKISDDEIHACASRNLGVMDAVGTDVQLLSPRPFTLMHSLGPVAFVEAWVAANNDAIARTVQHSPDRFSGVAALPQVPDAPVSIAFDELRRCVDLGFVGVLLNPDPSEGRGTSPRLDDRYWYPLYEKLCEYDLPALIHAAGCYNGREYYYEHFASEETLAVIALARSRVFDDFPRLKIIVAHAGGSVLQQIGRWRAQFAGLKELGKSDERKSFDDRLRKMWFDTCVYTRTPLELLFKEVGPDRCVFGTEKPGSGSAIDPSTGGDFDDIKPVIESIDFLTAEQRTAIFETNARSLFTRLAIAEPIAAR